MKKFLQFVLLLIFYASTVYSQSGENVKIAGITPIYASTKCAVSGDAIIKNRVDDVLLNLDAFDDTPGDLDLNFRIDLNGTLPSDWKVRVEIRKGFNLELVTNSLRLEGSAPYSSFGDSFSPKPVDFYNWPTTNDNNGNQYKPIPLPQDEERYQIWVALVDNQGNGNVRDIKVLKVQFFSQFPTIESISMISSIDHKVPTGYEDLDPNSAINLRVIASNNPGKNLSFLVNTISESNSAKGFDKVNFIITDGINTYTHEESIAPYAAFGDNHPDTDLQYNVWDETDLGFPISGDIYTLTVQLLKNNPGGAPPSVIDSRIINLDFFFCIILPEIQDLSIFEPGTTGTILTDGEVIDPSNGTSNFNFLATVVDPSCVKSIVFELTPHKSTVSIPSIKRVVNTSPYAFFGDQNPWDINLLPIPQEGDCYTISAVPYTNTNGTGRAGVGKSVDICFKEIDVPEIDYFNMWQGANLRSVFEKPGDVAYLDLTTGDFSLEAVSSNEQNTGSVRFVVSGPSTLDRTENSAPYVLNGDFNNWISHLAKPNAGDVYTVEAIPYEKPNMSGVAGKSKTIELRFFTPSSQTSPSRADLNGNFRGEALSSHQIKLIWKKNTTSNLPTITRSPGGNLSITDAEVQTFGEYQIYIDHNVKQGTNYTYTLNNNQGVIFLSTPCLDEVSTSLSYTDLQNDLIIENKLFDFGSINSNVPLRITNTNGHKVIIRNCEFRNFVRSGSNDFPYYTAGILSNSSNVIIEFCHLENMGGGFIFEGGGVEGTETNIKIRNNTFRDFTNNAQGTFNSFGHAVQFRGTRGWGIEVNNNRMNNQKGDAGDWINFLNFRAGGGNPDNWAQIKGNWIRCATNSASGWSRGLCTIGGAGIVVGDDGGDGFVISDNLLIQPTAFGIQAVEESISRNEDLRDKYGAIVFQENDPTKPKKVNVKRLKPGGNLLIKNNIIYGKRKAKDLAYSSLGLQIDKVYTFGNVRAYNNQIEYYRVKYPNDCDNTAAQIQNSVFVAFENTNIAYGKDQSGPNAILDPNTMLPLNNPETILPVEFVFSFVNDQQICSGVLNSSLTVPDVPLPIEIESSLSNYPNPARAGELFYIQLQSQEDFPGKVQILDINGQVLYQEDIASLDDSGSLAIRLPKSLRNGIYIYRVLGTKHAAIQGKLMIIR